VKHERRKGLNFKGSLFRSFREGAAIWGSRTESLGRKIAITTGAISVHLGPWGLRSPFKVSFAPDAIPGSVSVIKAMEATEITFTLSDSAAWAQAFETNPPLQNACTVGERANSLKVGCRCT